jgi:large conductance mechanosensitive channel
MWGDFKAFAFKGNVVDLAVGVIIGASFQKIVSALVDDLIMPIVGLMLPGGNWRDAGITLREMDPPGPEGDTIIRVGNLLAVTLDFLIVAFVLFLIVRIVVRQHAKAEPAA